MELVKLDDFFPFSFKVHQNHQAMQGYIQLVQSFQVFNWTETWDHNVGEIATNEEYDSCSDPGIVLGPGVRTILNSTSSRFFICTVGDHREQGQKVSITVGSPTTTSFLLAPPPPSSHASSLTTTTLRTFVGLISTLVAVFSFVA
ncbi:hypothetical protein ACFX2I_026061 [Malus domestica]